MTTLTEIITAIINGDVDDDFPAIRDAIKDRRDTVARIGFHSLQLNDPVILTGAQKYLEGCKAHVVEKKRTKIVIALDESRGRYTAGTRLNADPTLIRFDPTRKAES